MKAKNRAFEALYKFEKKRGLIETNETESADPAHVYKGKNGTSKTGEKIWKSRS